MYGSQVWDINNPSLYVYVMCLCVCVCWAGLLFFVSVNDFKLTFAVLGLILFLFRRAVKREHNNNNKIHYTAIVFFHLCHFLASVKLKSNDYNITYTIILLYVILLIIINIIYWFYVYKYTECFKVFVPVNELFN